jgi:hypothetical protein
MNAEYSAEIKKYIADIKVANNEEAKKQRLLSLLNRLFGANAGAREIIDKFTIGAEKIVLNIHRQGKVSNHGRADTQYQRVIIEFEKDLKKTGEHAKDQLAEYLSGNWNSGDNYNFTLISTDCSEWRVYAPTLETISSSKKLAAEDVVLIEKETIVLSENKAEEFYFFLDAYLFKSEKQKATLHNIQQDFGQTSNTFITCFHELNEYFQKVKDSGEVKVAFDQWKRFLSIAYDEFEASERVFLVHTYLSIFAKMLAYEIITHDSHIDDDEMRGIILGDIFDKFNIKNFIDNDFFHWIGSETAIHNLKKAFRALSSQIDCYDFNFVEEDILKGVYQELIDRDTRQSLGEYYTPDWLCESIVNELAFNENTKVLDPSCGSGSFLRATIDKIKALYPDLGADVISQNVVGIDIHPLSVLIAKTTMLVALGKKIKEAKSPIFLNVFLADTLGTPVSSVSLDMFGDHYDIWIDQKRYALNTSVFQNAGIFDAAIHAAEDLAEATQGKTTFTLKQFETALRKQTTRNVPDYQLSGFYEIYKGLKEAKEAGRDSIWKFIILNLYKPCFFYHYFDYVIGNPPWFTYGAIQNSKYQERLKMLAVAHGVMPKQVANFPHLEIAAIFLAHCVNYFLKDEGNLAFVLPRSFLSADHHENTRSGETKHVRITNIWDLDKVKPLFNVPACVLFADRARMSKKLPIAGREGKIFSGSLPKHNATLAEVGKRLIINACKFFYGTLGKSSAFTTHKMDKSTNVNPYKKLFKQGATLVPRNFYFVDVTQDISEKDLKDRVITVQTSKETDKNAKEPWKGNILTGRVHTDFIFRTALAENILPFVLCNPKLVLLPIELEGQKSIKMLSSKQLLERGQLDTAKWFADVEKRWNANKTQLNKNATNTDWLNYQNKLTTQKISSKFLVMYNTSAKDANAVVLNIADIDRQFVVDYTTYVYFTNVEDEAYFLVAFLNADEPNRIIKDFQARGLFGARHVSKKILDVPFTAYDENNLLHRKLAALGKLCVKKATTLVEEMGLSKDLSNHALGKARLAIKAHLEKEIKEIDALIKQIAKN